MVWGPGTRAILWPVAGRYLDPGSNPYSTLERLTWGIWRGYSGNPGPGRRILGLDLGRGSNEVDMILPQELYAYFL